MRILADGDVLTWQRSGGISRVFIRLLEELVVLGVDVCPVVPQDCRARLPVALQDSASTYSRMDPSTLRPWFLWSRVAPFWNARRRRRAIRSVNADVFCSSFYTTTSGMPSVALVYDMITERHPEWFESEYVQDMFRRKKKAICSADRVICISESTRNDVIQLLGIEPARCTVIYPGAGMTTHAETPTALAQNDEKFLLFVGGHKARHKNYEMLRKCFLSQKDDAFSGYDLIVVSSYTHDNEPTAEGRIKFMRHCPDAELVDLYSRCAAFVYPSLYEGFGIPVLEALAVGAPVACSNTSSLPEVGGDVVSYFDPLSEESVLAGITGALSEGRAPGAVARRTAQAGKFSWRKMAEECLGVAGKVVKDRQQEA